MGTASKIIGIEPSAILKIDGVAIASAAKIAGQTIESFSSTLCFDFDGVNDYLNWGDDPSLSGATTTNFSLAFWLNAPSYTDWDIFAIRGRWSTSGWFIYVQGGQLRFERPGFTEYAYITLGSGAGELDTNVWQHVTITYNATSKVKTMYLDGALANASPWSSTFVMNNDESLILCSNENMSGNFPPCKMDEVAYWNVELSAANILEIFGGVSGKGNGSYKDLSSLSAPTPHAWLRMGENAPAFATSDPQWLVIENSNAV